MELPGRHADLTPLKAIAVGELLIEAGVPQGAVEIVTTTDPSAVVTTWLEDPRVRKVSFTGSTAVGSRLLHQAADRVLNASMELGATRRSSSPRTPTSTPRSPEP